MCISYTLFFFKRRTYFLLIFSHDISLTLIIVIVIQVDSKNTFKGSLFLELFGDRAVGICRTECAGAVEPAEDMDPAHFVCELWLNPWVTVSGTLWQPHPNDPARDYAVHQEVPCSCTPVPSTPCATPPLCPTLPSALLFSSTSPHFCLPSQGDGNLSLLSLLNIDTNVKQFVLHTRHTGNTNSCWEKAGSTKV